jgi:acyl-CoA synthetase (AMP-forming)/AMP-acid ligase II
MPLYHSSALLLGFLNSMEAGAAIAVGRKFSTKTFWKEVRESKATIIHYVGETCRYLLARPPEFDAATGENLDKKHHVKVAFGNGLRPDVWDKFKDRFGIESIAEFYAATESPIGLWNLSSNDFSKGAVGRFGWIYNFAMCFSSSINIAVIKVDYATNQPLRDAKTGFCTKVHSGQPGEMIVKLPPDIETRFQGYHSDKAATNSKILRSAFVKGDAWFSTGDIITWHSNGLIYFSDRIGDTFRWKSENVSTAEVSQAVGLHPAVREANVYGVQLPHHDGRAGCVAIVLNQTPSEDLLRSLATHMKNTLPKYAVPLFLRVIPETGVQITGTNKHQKHLLRMHGVEPDKCAPDQVLWLCNGTYRPFSKRDWDELSGGRVKL